MRLGKRVPRFTLEMRRQYLESLSLKGSREQHGAFTGAALDPRAIAILDLAND